jgi:pseudouridine synthase
VEATAGPPGTERLQKVLADAGIASRRDCELAVQAGRVRVNGRIVRELPCWVRPDNDLVEWDGEIVDVSRRARLDQSYLYFAVNKPKGVISTARDPQGRPQVVGLVAAALPRGQRVYPVGRLDADSTGLMLLTNDGELAHRLAHPRYGIEKAYRVTVEGLLDAEVIATLKRGMYLADPAAIARSKGGRRSGGAKRAAMESLRVLHTTKDRRSGGLSLLSVTLKEGQNREIRRLLARVGLKVRKLERVSIGPLQLKGLKPGAYRALTPAEVTALRRSVLL